ncbi:Alpha/beta hydrolase family-domain-containing protein [Mycena amicta]|nr:Alpha/beta hydrolase family-domain-containing protein [Mycena amicta]
MSQLQITASVFECPQNVRDNPGRRLKMSVKRYALRESLPSSSGSSLGLTLLFAHCIGSHKEQWEPTLERIFALHAQDGLVAEAYAFDWQMHGDSAVLNRELLGTSASRIYGVSATEWAEAIGALVGSWMQGKRIVAIGHSAGAGTMILSTKHLPSSTAYTALIAIEPTVIPAELFYRQLDERLSTMEFVVSATLTRRETWPSTEAAFAWMRKRAPWSEWDERVLRRLVDYGLETLPDSKGVRIKGDRKQEALSYSEPQPHFEAATLLASRPIAGKVHFIWADAQDHPLVPYFVQDALVVGAASVQKIVGGHLLVQESPDELATAICAILAGVATAGGTIVAGARASRL